MLKLQRSEEQIFANYGLDFEGQYAVYYGKTAVNVKLEHRSISYRKKIWRVYEESLEKN